MAGTQFSLNSVRQDFISGLVVFLVAIPLCLGVALASNAPLFSGLLAGIIGGIVVGTLSKSHVSVSGPSPGIIALLLAAGAAIGSFPGVLLAVFFAGLLQILIGKFKAGFIADYIPTSVIHGLLAGIGIVIIIKQIPFAVGFFSEEKDIINELRQIPPSINSGPLRYLISHFSNSAIIISLLSLALLKGWEHVKSPRLKLIPGPILVILLGVFANEFFKHFFPQFYLQERHYLVTIPVMDEIRDFHKLFILPDFTFLSNLNVYVFAVMIALLNSVETLLNLEAAERIDPQKRYCNRDRELIAQGAGNTLCGLLGAIPITSVVVRSTVNVQAGCKTKLSAIFHGLLMLVFVVLFPNLLNYIPLASLAAILIFVGFKLASPAEFKTVYSKGLENFLPFIVTVVLIVSANLLTGVIAGLIVSSFWVMKAHSKPKFNLKKELYPDSTVIRFKLPEQLSFLNKAALINEFESLPENAQVILDGSKTKHMDFDILEVIEDFTTNLSHEKNISLKLIFSDPLQAKNSRRDFVNITTKEVQQSLSPIEILTLLKEGNARFLNNTFIKRNLQEQVKLTAKGQHPLAVVLSCIDSRVPVEKVFDVGVGDLFVVRVAGNIVNDDVLASIEYATLYAGAKLIVVMGHTECGAVKAACQDAGDGVVKQLLNKIKPAVDSVYENKSLNESDAQLEERVTLTNIKNSKIHLLEKSPELQTRMNDQSIGLVGAMYDVKTGKVSFDEDVNQQG